ncbi:glucose-1-phosphate cytidylyltransferase [Sulfobacillus harzensis]|uniref:Glucose-1-phosphate cytidylyltransferase n=1 Tax=Sulfobacillus harzensis TaxID=2729629 RepID=A0A7Y0Q565_9FIRM|nr:glucose-1-phosphate cytidylyltransferase [Sulfobacillus harzensis]
MKVVILAGGRGTRLSEETGIRPKPMVEIGGKPVLWHIMKIYSTQGFNEFVICLGYKGYQIKEYFINYFTHNSDLTVDLATNKVELHHCTSEPWHVTLVDTGESTETGGRLTRIQKYVSNEPFFMTYGDGLADFDLDSLLNRHHLNPNAVATVTAVQPLGRFGSMTTEPSGQVATFVEKPQGDGSWINGGFFVLEPPIFDYIQDDTEQFERQPLGRLTRDGGLFAYHHTGFWHPMDTLRDKEILNRLWTEKKAPWKIWE